MNQGKKQYRFASDDGHCFQIWVGDEGAQYLMAEGCDPLEVRKWVDGKPITTDGCVGQPMKEQTHSVEGLLAMLKESHQVVRICARRLEKAQAIQQDYISQLASQGVVITDSFFTE